MNNKVGAGAAIPAKDADAIVRLPCRVGAVLGDPARRRFLASGHSAPRSPHSPPLAGIQAVLGDAEPAAGLAALRLWGQSGTRPFGWVAGADPVWLRAGMEVIILEPSAPGDVPPDELAELFGDVQRALLADSPWTLEVVDDRGYLRGAEPMPTALLPPDRVDAATPDAYRPGSKEAPAAFALSSEIQMYLHDHAFNRAREQAGKMPLNDLWFWGGGEAPQPAARELPGVFTDDPLYRGYWHFRHAHCRNWPGSIGRCREALDTQFVAVPPRDADAASLCDELQSLWSSREFRAVTVLFDDMQINLRRRLGSWLRSRDKVIKEWPAE